MKKKYADKWVKALRSGKYEQGYSNLEYNNKYCCLGVLCKINKFDPRQIAYDINVELLNNSIMKKTGMKSNDGSLSGMPDLTELNDDEYTFDEIADIIQLLYKEL